MQPLYKLIFAIILPLTLATNTIAIYPLPYPNNHLEGIPVPRELVAIAHCESNNRQFHEDGSVVTNKNKNGTIDVGRWQINSIHFKTAEEMNIDVYTEKGNREYALYLYERNGTKDWKFSSKCWKNKI